MVFYIPNEGRHIRIPSKYSDMLIRIPLKTGGELTVKRHEHPLKLKLRWTPVYVNIPCLPTYLPTYLVLVAPGGT